MFRALCFVLTGGGWRSVVSQMGLQVGSDYIPFVWADDDAAAGAAAMGARAGAEQRVGGIQWRATADGSGVRGGAGMVALERAPTGSLCCSGQTHDWTKIRPVLAPLGTTQGHPC